MESRCFFQRRASFPSLELLPPARGMVEQWWTISFPHRYVRGVKCYCWGKERGGLKAVLLIQVLLNFGVRRTCITEWLFSNSDFYQSKKFPSSIQFFFLCKKCFCSSGRCSCPALALSSGSCCFVVAVKWVRKAIIKCSLSCSSL